MAHHASRLASRPSPTAPDRASRGGVQTARTEPARGPLARGSMQGLRIGAADDPLEAEADRIAHRVLHAPPGAPDPLEPGAPARPSAPRNHLGHASGLLGSGRPLPDSERAFFEPRLSWSLADVRIHDEPRASQAAASMNARAFTLGNHVAFAPGQWRPGTPDGRQLLAHELAHIQQARSGADPGAIRRAINFEMQLKGNRVYAYDGEGKKLKPLPRKFGPGDSLVEDPSGLRLESETQGQLEFETKWESELLKIEPQIQAALSMVKQMQTAPVLGVDTEKGYQLLEYPFSTDHLRPGGWKVPEGKRATDFEDNKEKGAIRDRPLPIKRELVIVNADSKWTAYFQTSESFPLGQFDSFLDSYETDYYEPRKGEGEDKGPSLPDGRVKDNKDVSKYVQGEATRVADEVIERARKKQGAGDAAAPPKASPGGSASAAHPELRNFLEMVISYLYRGVYPAFSPAGHPAKFAFSTMSKTHLGSVFALLSAEDQALFASFVKGADTLFLKSLGVTKKSRFFAYRRGKTKGVSSFNPTIGEWLGSILAGRDLLSSLDSPGRLPSAMGGKRVGADKLIGYEVRVTDHNEVEPEGWLKYVRARFRDASRRQKKPETETRQKE